MATFYIENENGNIFSADGSRRFIKLSGRAAYEYLKTEECNAKRFMKTSSFEETGDVEWVEVPACCMRQHRQSERREQYMSDCIEESGFITISFYATEDDESTDVASGEELIADPDCDVEEQALRNITIDTLREALATLTEDEMWLVTQLYLADGYMSDCELSKASGIARTTINYRKRRVLKKLKMISRFFLFQKWKNRSICKRHLCA